MANSNADNGLTTKHAFMAYQESCGAPLQMLGCATVSAPNFPTSTTTVKYCYLPNGERKPMTTRVQRPDTPITFDVTYQEEGYAQLMDNLLKRPCQGGYFWYFLSSAPVDVGRPSAAVSKCIVKTTRFCVANIERTGSGPLLDSFTDGGEDVTTTVTVSATEFNEYRTPAGAGIVTNIAANLTTVDSLPVNCGGNCAIEAGTCTHQVGASNAAPSVWYTEDGFTSDATQMPTDPSTANVLRVVYLPNGRVIAFLDDGTVFCTDDKGATWNAALNTPDAVIAGHKAVYVSDDGVIYAGTTTGNIFASLDDGASFVQMNAATLGFQINSIQHCGECKLVIGGDTGEVYVSTNEGATAYALVSPGAIAINQVLCCGDEIHALGSDGTLYVYGNSEPTIAPSSVSLNASKTAFIDGALDCAWYSEDCCCRIYLGTTAAGDSAGIYTINGGTNYSSLDLASGATAAGTQGMEVCDCECFSFYGNVVGTGAYVRRFCGSTGGGC